MRIALDTTYSVDKCPSGVAVYSREIMAGLAAAQPEDLFLHCYRSKQWRHAPAAGKKNIKTHLLLPFTRGVFWNARIFHALNQRVDRRPAPRVVTTFHDLFVMTSSYSSPEFCARFTRQARKAAQLSDIIIAVSDFTANQVHTLLGVERSRIRVVPHGVHRVEPAERKPEKMILSVGAIQHRKNTARLVDAFATLPSDWSLVLAGSTAGYRGEEILQKIRQSTAHRRITVTGYVTPEDLTKLYARAAIFAFPSLAEGFGIPVLEAMAHGVPVITSNSSALPEVAGDAALLVDPRRTEDIAMAMVKLAGDAATQEKLAAAGIARAAQFSWESSVAKTYQVYREL